MKRYRDYRDYLRAHKVPFGSPWVTRDSDRNPEGEKPQALSAEHDSAGPKDIAQKTVLPFRKPRHSQ